MNDIRSILLHLDNSPTSAARLEFARNLALRHEANLNAMFVAAPPQRPVQLALSESPAALLQPLDWVDPKPARAWFDDAQSAGGPAMQWLEGDVESFVCQALYADVLVLGQHDPQAALPGTAPADFVESVLLDSGKPALILPFAEKFDSAGRCVLIGWNETPQAARAVASALPWLRAARQVHVLSSTESRQRVEGLDIERHLQLHGITATLHRTTQPSAEAGDALLSFASDVDADLLVMGCYGRSRAREFLLGGATRTVLRTMTVPVLMAH